MIGEFRWREFPGIFQFGIIATFTRHKATGWHESLIGCYDFTNSRCKRPISLSDGRRVVIVVRVVARGIGWHVEEIRSQWASRHDTVVWNVRQLRFTQILQRDNVTKVVVGLLYAVLTVRHPNLDARNLNAAIDERIVRQRLIV